MSRHLAREKAFQMLFQLDFNKQDIETYIESASGNDEDPFLFQIVSGVTNYVEDLDHLIKQHLENWSLDRIAVVEKTILRMAIFEMKHMDDIPKSVSINEAVELAKKYGDEQAGKFVNGVLAKII